MNLGAVPRLDAGGHVWRGRRAEGLRSTISFVAAVALLGESRLRGDWLGLRLGDTFHELLHPLMGHSQQHCHISVGGSL